MKIFLGNAPWKKPGIYGVRAGSRWPHFEKEGCRYLPFPFFLAYAAALLKQNRLEVLLVDGIAENMSEDDFFAKAKNFDPDLILYEVSTASFNTDLKILERTRSLWGHAVKIAIAGPHAEMFHPEFLDRHALVDFILVGEYEFNLLSLLTHLQNQKSLETVPGLIYRDERGQAVKTTPYHLQKDLDRFPWPAREFLPMLKYRDCPGGIPTPSLQVMASRGCPFQCIYCAWPQLMYGGHSYRVRSPQDVVDEIEACIHQYGFQSFYFDDDTFNIGKPRVMALAAEIRQRRLNLPWAIMARADTMDREMLEALKDAGLTALKYGVESGAQEIVTRAGKKLDLDKVRETVRFTREMGVKYHLTFMLGLPGETWETVQQTIRFALELDPTSLQISLAIPFPGSEFYRLLKEKGHLLSDNFDDYDGYHHAVARTNELSGEDLERALSMSRDSWTKHVRDRQRNPVEVRSIP